MRHMGSGSREVGAGRPALVAPVRGVERGSSLVELLVAMAIVLATIGGVFMAMHPSQGAFLVQPETADLQQRLRASAGALARDLRMAGAGVAAASGPTDWTGEGGSHAHGGSLMRSFAPVVPFRRGLAGQDPPATFRADTISIAYVPWSGSTAVIASGAGMAGPADDLRVWATTGCEPGRASCGFEGGAQAVVFDEWGHMDLFRVTTTTPMAMLWGAIGHAPANLSFPYFAGAHVAAISHHVYSLDTTTNQLIHDDGFSTRTPVVDDVVGLRFEYWGEAGAPAMWVEPRGEPDPDAPFGGRGWTSYGPVPPAAGVIGAGCLPGQPSGPACTDAPSPWYFGAGENCVFQLGADGRHVPRGELPNLGAGDALVLLEAGALTDGPWCPDPLSPNRFDADLLRVRRIRVTLRVQSALAALRGPAGALFRRAGTATTARYLADYEARFDVTPANMSVDR